MAFCLDSTRWQSQITTSVLLSAAVLLPLSSALASNITVQSVNANAGGTYAARLVVSKTCTAGDAVIPNGPISSDPPQEPCRDLRANDVDVTGGSVRFKAGQSVALGNGFSVASPASFVVEVGATVLGAAFLRDLSPDAESEYAVRFYIDPASLILTQSTQQFEHFIAYDGQGNREFVLGVTYNPAQAERRLYAIAYENAGTMRTTKGLCEQSLASGWQSIEAQWKASTGVDGDLEVSINGGASQSLATCLSLGAGLGNSGGEISSVEWGAQHMTDGDLGSMDLDDFASSRFGPVGSL